MSREVRTLHDVFAPDLERLATPEGTSTRTALQQAIAARIPSAPARTIDAVLARMRDLLQIDLSTIVGLAVSQSELLSEFLDTETLHPAEAMEVALAEHAIESTHAPSMAIEVDGVTLGTIGVDIDLALTFEGMILNIAQWALHELNPGACAVTGTLGCLGITLAEKETEPVTLPSRMHLPTPLAIRRPAFASPCASGTNDGLLARENEEA